ncbi:hypothetical protein Poli38472_014147 [Pythium oligandrum]|uniref:Uncharacterized protein n=1 Tax=Pythium oligandrum TaxID=41045 RepID=A0A8K1CIV5_PYTOL|nr:hypothetical protein Poli38472_014147 [Pythium oligandrum]|eukprot:TMW64030.1 hypothetical protein Poli38472_014147 [Pythium oligandrum]
MMTESMLDGDAARRQRLQAFLQHERAPPTKPPTHVTNDVTDIAGARPLLKDHVYVNKPHFYDAHDIHGSVSKELHPKNRRVGGDDRFKQLPIEGSSPMPSGFKTDRVVNPLEPAYILPSFKEAPPLIPKFLRDSYNVSDIDGTSFKKKVIQNPRSPTRLDDIPGAQAGWLPANKRPLREHPPRDIIDVADIVNVGFKSSRVTNVLNPVYTVNGMTSQDDAQMRSKILHPQLQKPSYALQTSDIAGANPYDASKNVVGGIPNEKRRGFRTTNRTDDINGAKADTVLHSIHSNRRVDPNWPEYVVLDGRRVDASAMSVAKSIVFADLIQQHDMVWGTPEEEEPYVVSGIANIGMVGRDKPKPRRATAPAVVLSQSSKKAIVSAGAAALASGSSGSSSGRISSTERKQLESRREEIQMVRDLK